ncbi:hypothetical protein EW146_g1935 [Bondarzewia mesenterica]|uniref:Uncharacterized protein n=1 Tax=Bondarzewia mesenterica TaxID=1095465 RepID=A0A4S4M4G3_9AGAM|nr:hypothetical protein EW146_g1935 [Bondarzewia mesenterica]
MESAVRAHGTSILENGIRCFNASTLAPESDDAIGPHRHLTRIGPTRPHADPSARAFPRARLKLYSDQQPEMSYYNLRRLWDSKNERFASAVTVLSSEPLARALPFPLSPQTQKLSALSTMRRDIQPRSEFVPELAQGLVGLVDPVRIEEQGASAKRASAQSYAYSLTYDTAQHPKSLLPEAIECFHVFVFRTSLDLDLDDSSESVSVSLDPNPSRPSPAVYVFIIIFDRPAPRAARLANDTILVAIVSDRIARIEFEYLGGSLCCRIVIFEMHVSQVSASARTPIISCVDDSRPIAARESCSIFNINRAVLVVAKYRYLHLWHAHQRKLDQLREATSTAPPRLASARSFANRTTSSDSISWFRFYHS